MVRIMPYRTLENIIDGVVITFADITRSRTLEAKLRDSLVLYQAPFERIGEGIILQAAGGDVTFMNTAAERILGFPHDEMQKRTATDPLAQAVHGDGTPFSEVECPTTVALATSAPVENVVMGVLNPSSQQRTWINVAATPVLLPGEDKPSHVYMIFKEIPKDRAVHGPGEEKRGPGREKEGGHTPKRKGYVAGPKSG
jgi:hypothetical protein